MTDHHQQPNWQPLSQLPMLTAHMQEGVDHAQDQLATLKQAGPYQLDDATVARIRKVWTRTRDDLADLFDEQGRRWTVAAAGTEYTRPVREFCELVEAEQGLTDEILDLADQLEKVTIERLMEKSDFEVGLEAMQRLLGPNS